MFRKSTLTLFFCGTLFQGEKKIKQLQSMVKMGGKEADADSWLNIKDEEDPRGRIGVQWPWDR